MRMRKHLMDLKNSTPCTDCKISYPYYMMEFDHLRDKKHNLANMFLRSGMKKVIEEVAKCEIVCANCHKKRTYDRLNKAE